MIKPSVKLGKIWAPRTTGGGKTQRRFICKLISWSFSSKKNFSYDSKRGYSIATSQG